MINENEVESEETKKYYSNIENVIDRFYDSKLGAHSITFRNRIGMFLTKMTNGLDDSIMEVITEIHELSSILPYSAEIRISAIQFEIKTKSDLPRQMVSELMERYVHQGTMFPYGKGIEDYYITKLFLQTMDYYDENFEEFLKTYPEFLEKKFRKLIRK